MKKFLALIFSLLTLATSLEAREVISLNDNWRFYFSSENSADYARTIALPHTWNYDNSNSLVWAQSTAGNYLRDIFIPAEWSGKRLFIKFYGVQSVGDLLINGRYVGQHRGGSTAFTFEITKHVTFGQSNRLHMMVSDAPQNDVLPTSYEQNNYGGIYRDVELIVTDPVAVSPTYYGSDGVFVEQHKVSTDRAEGVVSVYLDAPEVNHCQLAVSIFDPAGDVVYQKIVAKAKIGDEPARVPFTIISPQLWSPAEPSLYRFEVNALSDDYSDKVVVESGFRTIEFANSGLLRLNGEPIQMRTVSLNHDYPHVGGAASPCDIESDMALIEEVGANAIRSVAHPHHPYLYELCDKAGKMVWIDFPLCRAPFLSDIAYFPTKNFHAQGRETMHEIIAQNYNHPSVVMWGIFSLLSTRGDSPIPYVEELNKLAKKLDPSRLTVAESDQDGTINTISDLIVWRQNLGWSKGSYDDLAIWSNLLHTKWNNLRSGVSYGQNGRADQQSKPSEYKSATRESADAWKPEGRQRVFHEQYAQRLLADSLFWGVCVNSMFDFKSSRNALGENNMGLMSFDRRTRKDIFYLYKAHWNKQQPTLHIADSRSRITTDNIHAISVFASDTLPPTLYVGNDTITLKRLAPWQFGADSIKLQQGTNKMVVRQGNLADSSIVVLQQTYTPPAPRPRFNSRSSR